MKVIFFLPAGTVEWGVPPDAQAGFVFNNLVGKVRSDGYFMAADLYIQHAAIVGMMFTAEGAALPAITAGMTRQ